MLALPLALFRFTTAGPDSGDDEEACALVAESFNEDWDLYVEMVLPGSNPLTMLV